MLIKYVGPKALPYRLNTPIPFLAKSEQIGTLEFTPDCDVPNEEWSLFLLRECGDNFLQVGAPSPPESETTLNEEKLTKEQKFELQVQKAKGRRFSGKAGKWQAKAYLKRCHLTERLGLKKLQIGDKVVHWEVVPIALADVTVNATQPISVEPEGQEESHEHDRDITV